MTNTDQTPADPTPPAPSLTQGENLTYMQIYWRLMPVLLQRVSIGLGSVLWALLSAYLGQVGAIWGISSLFLIPFGLVFLVTGGITMLKGVSLWTYLGKMIGYSGLAFWAIASISLRGLQFNLAVLLALILTYGYQAVRGFRVLRRIHQLFPADFRQYLMDIADVMRTGGTDTIRFHWNGKERCLYLGTDLVVAAGVRRLDEAFICVPDDFYVTHQGKPNPEKAEVSLLLHYQSSGVERGIMEEKEYSRYLHWRYKHPNRGRPPQDDLSGEDTEKPDQKEAKMVQNGGEKTPAPSDDE